jgi:hypothetical protein
VVLFAVPDSEEPFPETIVKPVMSMAKTAVYLARQKDALLGTEAFFTKNFQIDGSHFLFENLPWKYPNFDALILFRLDAGDQDLLRHIQTAPKNAHFLSTTSQNKYLELAGMQIQIQVTAEADASPFFSVILDGTIDTSGKEQLTFFVRYLREAEIYEEFVEFADVSTSTTGIHARRYHSEFFVNRIECRRISH